jgi:hypothetical protein
MSWRAAWMALWMVKPAGLMGQGLSPTLFPCMSIFTRLEAVISSNIIPYGLIRKWCSGPGTRAVIWVKTRSSQWKWATSR